MRRYIDRAYEREQVDIAARIVMRAERLTVIPCRIVDRADGGMKVEMCVACMLPGTVFVLEDGAEDLLECKTCWQDEATAGLKLIDVCMYSTRREIMAKFPGAEVLAPPPEKNAAVAGL